MDIRLIQRSDRDDWLLMRTALWPDSSDDHAREIDHYFTGTSPCIDQVYVCDIGDDTAVGFVELRIRNYAEGSNEIEVPYVEGWYVGPGFRRQGAGALLMAQAERWAKGLGYSEMASDAEIDNSRSIAAHLALGFEEVERAVCFLKKLL